MKTHLTSKQQKVLDAVKEFQRVNNQIPSYKDLADALGYSSVNSIQQFINVLAEKKYLEVEKAKGIKSINTGRKQEKELVSIPLLGRVACGAPLLAVENIEGYISVSKELIKNRPNNYFFLKAHGESMNDAGIDDNDLLLIESQSIANPSEIVLALIDDEATVKYYKPQKDYVVLLPKSKDDKYKPIVISKDFSIQGVVRRVVKIND
ncbi:MAG: repressor LexA [Elusimicrobia bacterium RIFOXYA1_FULL_47_7]|nr:MAG: repressor LexA [Elusimicrobia bacterium RIFOXYA1_FULL_47_7]OGS15745.1 MAG: repressor LexA [Elusimicrobia bacterium RIFOXYA2_FULL_47_53]OGS31046.1 MAG: repressor LexA [Elusimicrobia bacterium RIFOXYB2_FULL_46_23]